MFDFTQQANTLGHHVNRFADLVKRLNGGMLENVSTQRYIQKIVGQGRFNHAVIDTVPDMALRKDFNPEATVLYGDDLRKARIQKNGQHQGLFAALPAFHHPLLGFAQLLLVDLGQKGFKCIVTHQGQKLTIPLHELKIDFDDEGTIFTISPITSAEGKVLPAKFVLSKKVGAEFTPLMPNFGSLHCDIVDASNKSVGIVLLPKLLWTGVTSKGKNIYGEESKKVGILALLGIDDMEDANRFLTDTVKELQQDHRYDPQPLWNRVMASAHEQLKPHTEALAITREAIALGNKKGKIFPAMMKSVEDPYNVATIDNLTQFFGIELPQLNSGQQQIATEIANGLAGSVQR